jgi:hypothetical protein
MFRRERPQKGRFRQFYQIGAEAIGSESPMVDAEVIEMVVELLQRAGLEGAHLIINSVGCKDCRPIFVAALRDQLKDIAPKLCSDCQRRAVTNPLRVLDCKVPEDQQYIDKLPSILDYLDEGCKTHFAEVRAHLGFARHRLRGSSATGSRPRLLHAHHLRNHARRAGRTEFRPRRRTLRRPRGIARLEGPRARELVFQSARIDW